MQFPAIPILDGKGKLSPAKVPPAGRDLVCRFYVPRVDELSFGRRPRAWTRRPHPDPLPGKGNTRPNGSCLCDSRRGQADWLTLVRGATTMTRQCGIFS